MPHQNAGPFVETSEGLNTPVMRVPQIEISTVSEAGFISEQEISKEICPCSRLLADLQKSKRALKFLLRRKLV
jgi:hypothetical protein